MNKTESVKKPFKPSLLIVLGIILVLTMIAQLAFLSVFGTRGKEVAKIRSQQKELILENELLEAEISKRQSLIRVKQVASEELGMINVGKVEYIKPNDMVGENNSPVEK
jgi:hypothetical protein